VLVMRKGRQTILFASPRPVEFAKIDSSFIWLLFDGAESEATEKKAFEMLDKHGDEALLSIYEEILYLAVDMRKEGQLWSFLSALPLPTTAEALDALITKIHRMVYTTHLDHVKYNLLAVLFRLGFGACQDILRRDKESHQQHDDVFVMSKPKLSNYILNNKVINMIWSLVHCDARVRNLALSVLHFYFENYQSIQPPAIEELFELYLTKILNQEDANSNPEIQFLSKYIAEHTFRLTIISKKSTLETESKRMRAMQGIGKIFLQTNPNLLFNNDGTIARNNTLQRQTTHLSKHVFSSEKSGTWYWEVIVSSPRHIKVGWTLDLGGGFLLPVTEYNECFGCVVDFERGIFKVSSKVGLVQESNISNAISTSSFLPSFEIGPLQQITFNFGPPNLVKPFNSRILSEIRCPHNQFEHSPQLTYRQMHTIPIKIQETTIRDDKDKKYYDPEAASSVPDTPTSMKRNHKSIKSPRKTDSVSSLKSSESRSRHKRGSERKGTKVKSNNDELAEFKCPITRDIMEDPVIAEDGQRYERTAILEWLKIHNTSPMNRIPMDPENLKSDSKLKTKITAWKEQNKIQ